MKRKQRLNEIICWRYHGTKHYRQDGDKTLRYYEVHLERERADKIESWQIGIWREGNPHQFINRICDKINTDQSIDPMCFDSGFTFKGETTENSHNESLKA